MIGVFMTIALTGIMNRFTKEHCLRFGQDFFFGQHNIILIKDMKSKKLNYYRKKNRIHLFKRTCLRRLVHLTVGLIF